MTSATNTLAGTATTEIPTLAKSDQNLVWIDCEMSGLDPEKERLLEIAVVITGPQLTPRIEGPVIVVHQSDAVLNAMDAWNKGTHGRSGLIDKVKASTVSEAEAEATLLAFIGKYVPKNVVTTGRVSAAAPITAPDFSFLQSTTQRAAKVTLPSPTRLHFHGGRGAVSPAVYPDIEQFFADIVKVYRAEIAALEAAGCRYIQIDDPLMTYFISDRIDC